MKKIKLIILASIFLLAFNTYAHDKLVFQCNTSHGKTMKIERDNDTLIYSYGTPNKTDITLNTKLYNLDIPGVFSSNVRLANKSGQYIYNSVSFINGEYSYNLTALSDVNVPSDKTFTGVDVYKKSTPVAKIQCVTDTIKDNFESLYN
ncbi:hypothetical protein D8682_26330 [Buttiauxella sp. 3AFRM03]|uniref:hypothetical protein n=1 Tax=Buttiauxella sp. 3AFRM03 TaxID=2479367 RepID=UPI000EF77139|nr:hypothetical protein [Buttiauxella sp. 3AFRM03]AYN30187.1 hypothetical protein D8682_26330 [Buttiauxella sp. 3AFRM03]